jgi:hypothetical protein
MAAPPNEYWPTRQFVHYDAFAAENLPGSHGKQEDWPLTAYIPATQIVHADRDCDPIGDDEPAGQFMQMIAPPRLYWPA